MASDPSVEPAIVPPPLPVGASAEDVAPWFDLETILDLPAPVASFADAADAAAQYRRASRADNTGRAYRTAVAHFCDWCAAIASTLGRPWKALGPRCR
jgi:hypothetical protein